MNDKDQCRYFSGRSAARNVITSALSDSRIIRIATAYFEPSGFQCLRDVLRGKEVKLLLGRSEKGDDKIQEVVKEFFDALAMGPYEERTRAMEELRDAIRRGVFLVNISDAEDSAFTTIGPRC